MRRKHRTFPLGKDSNLVAASGNVLTSDQRIDDNQASVISALAISTNRPDMVQARGRIRLEINGETIFDSLTPARMLLMGGNNVRPDERLFTRMGALPYGNGVMTATYTDVNNAAVPFEAYTVDLVLEYELKETAS